jgi:PKD repeat protein
MIINNSTLYPVFKQGQQLKSSSLTGIVDFTRLEEQDTRVYLEGSGIFYGLAVEWNAADGTLRLSPGTAVTSDGQLFSLEKEIIYNGIIKDVDVSLMKRTVSVMALSTNGEEHDDFVNRIAGNDPTEYLLILAVRSSESTKPSCLYGYKNNESEMLLEVEAALVDKNAFKQEELDAWFIKDTAEAGDKDPVINRFGYLKKEDFISFERFTDQETLSNGFREVCEAAEQGIGDAYNQLFELVKDKLSLSNNPFTNLAANLQSLRTNLSDSRLLPFVYDYYRDLIATYKEFVTTDVFSFLSSIPEKDRFRGYIALGSIRTRSGQQLEEVNYRMGLYRPPFADLSINALEKPLLLMKRMIYLVSNFSAEGVLQFNVKFTPDAGLNKALSDRSIPFYYKEPVSLSKVWNASLTRNHRTFSIPGITDEQDRKYFLSDIDPYKFYRIKGHIGESIQATQEAILEQRSRLHLPFDLRILYLGSDEDMNELIRERSAGFSDLRVMLEKIVNDIRCMRRCSDQFEEFIFKGKFNRDDIGSMFEMLVVLFQGQTLEELIKKTCGGKDGLCEDVVCCTAQLTSLYAVYEEYVRRKTELADNLLFHRFAMSHPGLEHSGGVPRGGTLVLVCARRDVNRLSENKKAVLMKLMLSSDTEKNAEAKSMAEELLNYEVVADFCLPYICCGGPSIKIEFQSLPPVAKFSITELEPNEEGAMVVLKNESIRANTYHWQLLDFNGDPVEETDTEEASFKLLYEKGINYTIILTASRDGMTSQYEDTVNICPQGNVTITSNGKPEAAWDINTPMQLPLEISPFGGTFTLTLFINETQQEIDASQYSVVWKEDKKNAILSINKPLIGEYSLRYSFDNVEGCSDAMKAISIFTQGGTVENLTNNNEKYLNGLNAMAEEDQAFSIEPKFTDTQNFLSGIGDYEPLVASLQTGFSKLKAAQKVQVARLLIFATASFIDAQVAASPEKVPAAAKKLIKTAADTIIAQKDGVDMWNKVWDPAAITTKENEKTVAAYKAMIA